MLFGDAMVKDFVRVAWVYLCDGKSRSCFNVGGVYVRMMATENGVDFGMNCSRKGVINRAGATEQSLISADFCFCLQ
jgi:hypothetical protein